MNLVKRLGAGLATSALAGGLASGALAQGAEESVQRKPISVRATYHTSPDAEGYELGIGHGTGILGEFLKLQYDDGAMDNFTFGLRTEFDFKDATNTLWFTGSTMQDGIGLESKTRFRDTTLDLSFDRTADAHHIGAGLDQKISDNIFGVRFDHVHLDFGDTNQILFKYIKDISPESDIGFGYAFVSRDNADDTHSFTGFVSHAGPDVDLGGRAWANISVSGDDFRVIGEGILGQNFRKGYTRWTVGGEESDAALHSQATFQSPFARDIINYIGLWNRVESGLVGGVKGAFGEVNGQEFSSLSAKAAYVVDFGNDRKAMPFLGYFTNFGDTNNLGAGLEIHTPLGPGSIRATIEIPDFEKTDEIQARVGYTVRF